MQIQITGILDIFIIEPKVSGDTHRVFHAAALAATQQKISDNGGYWQGPVGRSAGILLNLSSKVLAGRPMVRA
ncbi:MAG: hypothetical protein ABIO19_08240 [Burkholderiaceae bacterium]